MNNEAGFKFEEVNPPTYGLAKADKKIRTTNTDIKVDTTTILAVEIDGIRFEADERFPWITIYSWNEATLTRLDEIDGLDDNLKSIGTLEDLKVVALNWYFNNVEIVSEVDMKKEVEKTTQEVEVQEQSIKIHLDGKEIFRFVQKKSY